MPLEWTCKKIKNGRQGLHTTQYISPNKKKIFTKIRDVEECIGYEMPVVRRTRTGGSILTREDEEEGTIINDGQLEVKFQRHVNGMQKYLIFPKGWTVKRVASGFRGSKVRHYIPPSESVPHNDTGYNNSSSGDNNGSSSSSSSSSGTNISSSDNSIMTDEEKTMALIAQLQAEANAIPPRTRNSSPIDSITRNNVSTSSRISNKASDVTKGSSITKKRKRREGERKFDYLYFTSLNAVEDYLGFKLKMTERMIDGFQIKKKVYKPIMVGKKNENGRVEVPFGRGDFKELPDGWYGQTVSNDKHTTTYIGPNKNDPKFTSLKNLESYLNYTLPIIVGKRGKNSWKDKPVPPGVEKVKEMDEILDDELKLKYQGRILVSGKKGSKYTEKRVLPIGWTTGRYYLNQKQIVTHYISPPPECIHYKDVSKLEKYIGYALPTVEVVNKRKRNREESILNGSLHAANRQRGTRYGKIDKEGRYKIPFGRFSYKFLPEGWVCRSFSNSQKHYLGPNKEDEFTSLKSLEKFLGYELETVKKRRVKNKK